MIITTVKHGRTKRDGERLIAHLSKTENVEVDLAEVGNCVGETLTEFVSIAAIYRDAAPTSNANTVSFHHLTVNPAIDHPREMLIEMAHRARLELDPSGERPFAIVIHKKPRSEPGGGSGEHAHLLIAAAAADAGGKFLDDGFSKIRTERLALELAFDFGEPPVIGRHFKPAFRRLRTTRPEVAEWLESQVGADPAKPESAFSPNAMARARGLNLNLPKAKAAVRAAWNQSSDVEMFQRKLTEIGFSLKPGTRNGVWIIEDGKGRLIGSANRLLKLKRDEFNQLMEADNAEKLKPKNRAFRPGGRGFRQATHQTADRDRQYPARSATLDRINQRQAGRGSGSPRHASSLSRIHTPMLLRLIEKAVATQAALERHFLECEPPPSTDVYYDLWGIPRVAGPR